MKTKIFTLLTILSAIVSSCEKEFSKENATLPPVIQGSNDSTILKSFILLDTSGNTVDTLNVISFFYDNLERLTKEIIVTYFNNAPDYTDGYSTTYYYYNGNDTLPVKTVIVDFDSAGNNQLRVDSAVSFFSRNASNQITRDSTYYVSFYRNLGPSQGDVYITTSNFSIYADSVIENYRYEDPFGLIIGTNKYAQAKSNGNLRQEIFYILENTGYREIRRADYTYDSRVNPFMIRNINYPVTLKYDFGVREYPFKNNFTKEVWTESINTPPFVQTAVSVYTYNSLNYPKTVVEYDPANPSSAIKGIYIYTK